MSIAFPIVHWGGINIYEVNIRHYTHEGTLRAFTQHIPRLHQMDVDILWPIPATPISVVFSGEKEDVGRKQHYSCAAGEY